MIVRPINTEGKPASISTPYLSTHLGVDYAYPLGTPVYATDDGRVTFAKSDETRQWIANGKGDPFKPLFGSRALRTEDYGNFIKIAHDDTHSSLYAHLLPRPVVKAGDMVKKGQLIGYVGSTGNSTGAHLHFEYRNSERSIDPSSFMDVSFSNYGIINQETTPAPITDRRPYWFDLLNPPLFGGKPHERITDKEVVDIADAIPGRFFRAGQYDRLARMVGYTGDTNTLTAEVLYKLIIDKAPSYEEGRKKGRQEGIKACQDALKSIS